MAAPTLGALGRTFIVLAGFGLWMTAAEVVVMHDGATMAGQITREGVTWRAGGVALRLTEVDYFPLGLSASRATGPWLVLNDNSHLPGQLESAGPDQIALNGPWGHFVFPLSAVSRWGAAEISDKEDTVSLKGGTLRGRVSGLKEGALRIESTLKPEPIPLENITGLALSGGVRAPRQPFIQIQPDVRQPPVTVTMGAEGWQPALAISGVFSFGAESVRARVESPRRVYLSELVPTLVEDRGAFGVVWPWAKDAGLYEQQPLRLDGVLYPRGICVHSEARLRWDLSGKYQRMVMRWGIHDDLRPEGDLIAVLMVDDKERQRTRLRGAASGELVHVDLSGAKTLELRVELGERHDIGDHLVLAGAELIRAGR